ncbi:zf-HC2 domain-containing protein [Corynebacterium macginleyi]|nr:zf-HC2 domain-containing protein [Corynebacterium macginleyi]
MNVRRVSMDSIRRRRTFSSLSERCDFTPDQAKARDKAKARARRSDSIGHLGPEAVVAFVDGEMEPKAMHRVRIHLVHCAECRADVHHQRHASEWVRHCSDDSAVKAPQSLLAKLAGMATEGVAPGPDASTPAHRPEQDFLDKIETVVRAIKHNQRGQH